MVQRSPITDRLRAMEQGWAPTSCHLMEGSPEYDIPIIKARTAIDEFLFGT
jgi:hypothetical protein